MKAFETSTIGGKVRNVKLRTVGEYTILEFSISKRRKKKDKEQFTTHFCSLFSPPDWVKNSVHDGSEVIVTGEVWDREVDEKVYRTFEVSRVVAADRADKAPEKPQVERSAPEPTPTQADDDLPF